MVITLIGYRGTGKSTVAPRLAERLGWDWADADDLIQTRANKSIRDIFAEDGEATFRVYERDVMQTLLTRNQLVIAAGGGAILNAQTRQDMRTAGPVVWLTAPVETLMTRIAGDESTASRRPSLTGAGERTEIETVLRQREPLYHECADVVVETEGREISGIVDEIMAAIAPRIREGAAG